MIAKANTDKIANINIQLKTRVLKESANTQKNGYDLKSFQREEVIPRAHGQEQHRVISDCPELDRCAAVPQGWLAGLSRANSRRHWVCGQYKFLRDMGFLH